MKRDIKDKMPKIAWARKLYNAYNNVKKGDTVCIIEAMKIFNEIESDVSGVVKEICVENGNPVEFDQIIIKVSSD